MRYDLKILSKEILRFAQTSGSFTREQAYWMLGRYNNTVVDRTITYLLKDSKDIRKWADSDDKFVYYSNRFFEPKVVKALWIPVMHKINKADPSGLPFSVVMRKAGCAITYILGNTIYDSIVLDESNTAFVDAIDMRYDQEKAAGSAEHKVIYVVDNKDFVRSLPVIRIPHMYAIVDENNTEEPVTFFTDEDIE